MVNELRAVVKELGGEQTLGRSLSSDRDLREAIREGFPPAVVKGLMRASGLTLKELAGALDLSPRSLQRRRTSGRLARFESDRLYRLARIVAIANESLGGHERATIWLKHPNRALGGLAPVSAIDTELGARQVENILGRVAYGGIS
jgi:putative toxin-antitoxin system antitoxin component (TIGR02293 family)